MVTPAGVGCARDESRSRRRATPGASWSAIRRVQRIDVLAGRLIDELAAAEDQAEQGEIVLDASAPPRSATGRDPRAARTTEEGGRASASSTGCTRVGRAAGHRRAARCRTRSSREWLLPAVYERLRAGRGEFLAELRPASPLFVRFGGIDYDDDDDAIAKLDDFVRDVQRILATYGGNLLQLTLGDKGAISTRVRLAEAHEDDAARAAAAALELRRSQSMTAATGFQIGITYGRLRSGTYGHSRPAVVHLPRRCGQPRRAADGEAPPGRDPRAARCAGGGRRVHVGAARADREGKSRAGGGLRARPARSGTRRAAPRLRAPDRRAQAELDTIGAKLDEAIAGRGQHHRDRRRGRHGQIAARGRVRPRCARPAAASLRSASASRMARNTELLRLAGDLVDAVRSRR